MGEACAMELLADESLQAAAQGGQLTHGRGCSSGAYAQVPSANTHDLLVAHQNVKSGNGLPDFTRTCRAGRF